MPTVALFSVCALERQGWKRKPEYWLTGYQKANTTTEQQKDKKSTSKQDYPMLSRSLHPNNEWRSKQLKKAKEYANRIPNARSVIALEKHS